jgi:pimeloyl-ACP methyl ester carboxylesterase
MKRVLKKIGIGISACIALLIVVMLVTMIVHRVSLRSEQTRIVPIGQMVEVNGNMMHVYVSGEHEGAPLLVFLSGHGVPAPVFDFRPLYSLLTSEFRIAVVEKFGYGYSDIVDVTREIDSILSDTRTALYAVGETGPYVLIPHSMSGLEALRWAQLYQNEVVGIIGIDIGIPSIYLSEHLASSEFSIMFSMRFMQVVCWMGLHRLPFLRGLNDNHLVTEQEQEQNRLLVNRNLMNRVVVEEARNVVENARIIEQYGIANTPILLLVAEGSIEEVGAFWIQYQEEFARQSGAQIEILDTGHFIHHEKPEQVADLIRAFISELQE